MSKVLWLWVYEYKDDSTPVGATLYHGPASKIDEDGTFMLPHLSSEWHVRIDTEWHEEDEKG